MASRHPNRARGVDVFFAISGFLICTRLLQEHEKTGGISLGGFYIRRGLRILPPYFVYLAVLSLLAVGGVLMVEPREFLGCALFYPQLLRPPGSTRVVYRTFLEFGGRRTLLPLFSLIARLLR